LIEYTYTVGGTTYNFTEYFDLGYPIFWNLLNADFVAVDGTVNTIHAPSINDAGLAISQNTLAYLDEGWVTYNVDLYKYYYPVETEIPSLPIPTRGIIRFVDEDINTDVQVNVANYGGGIITKYVWVTGLHSEGFNTYKDGPIKIRRTDLGADSDWDYEVFFDNNLSPFSTIEEVDPTGDPQRVLNVFAKGNNVTFYEAYASFCGSKFVRNYADLTKKLDGGYYLAPNGIVKFIYNEEYNDQDNQLTYTIYDANNTIAVDEDDLSQAVVYGDNRYDLNFSSFSGDVVLENGVYVLEVMNEKNEKWYLRFKITMN